MLISVLCKASSHISGIMSFHQTMLSYWSHGMKNTHYTPGKMYLEYLTHPLIIESGYISLCSKGETGTILLRCPPPNEIMNWVIVYVERENTSEMPPPPPGTTGSGYQCREMLYFWDAPHWCACSRLIIYMKYLWDVPWWSNDSEYMYVYVMRATVHTWTMEVMNWVLLRCSP
jgi:hypothetical protein